MDQLILKLAGFHFIYPGTPEREKGQGGKPGPD